MAAGAPRADFKLVLKAVNEAQRLAIVAELMDILQSDQNSAAFAAHNVPMVLISGMTEAQARCLRTHVVRLAKLGAELILTSQPVGKMKSLRLAALPAATRRPASAFICPNCGERFIVARWQPAPAAAAPPAAQPAATAPPAAQLAAAAPEPLEAEPLVAEPLEGEALEAEPVAEAIAIEERAPEAQAEPEGQDEPETFSFSFAEEPEPAPAPEPAEPEPLFPPPPDAPLAPDATEQAPEPAPEPSPQPARPQPAPPVARPVPAQPPAAPPAPAQPTPPVARPVPAEPPAAPQARPAQAVPTAEPVQPALPIPTAQPVRPAQPVPTAKPVQAAQPVPTAQPVPQVRPAQPAEPVAARPKQDAAESKGPRYVVSVTNVRGSKQERLADLIAERQGITYEEALRVCEKTVVVVCRGGTSGEANEWREALLGIGIKAKIRKRGG